MQRTWALIYHASTYVFTTDGRLLQELLTLVIELVPKPTRETKEYA